MSTVEVVILDHLVERLGQLELQHKRLGLVNHAMGVRNAIALILEDVRISKLARTPSTPEEGAAIVHMVASLTTPHEHRLQAEPGLQH